MDPTEEWIAAHALQLWALLLLLALLAGDLAWQRAAEYLGKPTPGVQP